MNKTVFISAILLMLQFLGHAQTPLSLEYFNEIYPAGFILDIQGESAGNVLDFDGDGDRELTLQIGQTLVIRLYGSMQTLMLSPADMGIAGYDLNDFKFYGFYNVVGDAEKELVLGPKLGVGGPAYVCSLGSDNHFHPIYITLGDCFVTGILNLDGDEEMEIVTAVQNPFGLGGALGLGIFGQGLTPAAWHGGMEQLNSNIGCSDPLVVKQVLPPNFRWPAQLQIIPDSTIYFDQDSYPDFAYTAFDSDLTALILWVISGRTQDTLVQPIVLAESLSLNFTKIFFIDFCNSGSKQILVGMSNTGTQLRDMEIIMLIDTSTGEIVWALEMNNLLDNGFRLVSFIWNQGGVNMVFEHQTTKRVIIVGTGDGVVGGGGDESAIPPGNHQQLASGAYALNLIWESTTTASWAFLPREFSGAPDIDVNADDVPDIMSIIQLDSTSAESIGLMVKSGVDEQTLWNTPFPSGAQADPNPSFRGFYDADANGVKELFFGSETVITNDGQIHKPFSPGFMITNIIDLNQDGHEEVIGNTPEGNLQIWSSTSPLSGTEQIKSVVGGIAVSPNPSTDGHFNLFWTQRQTTEVVVELRNEQGMLLQTWNLGNVQAGETFQPIQVSAALPNGLYLARIRTAEVDQSIFLVLIR
ncbi:MAG: hypothetical protein JNJ57_11380 [Saprospiraceae bacterium]|nr:hypothetical protein [Saprospiraceae bacterium]